MRGRAQRLDVVSAMLALRSFAVLALLATIVPGAAALPFAEGAADGEVLVVKCFYFTDPGRTCVGDTGRCLGVEQENELADPSYSCAGVSSSRLA